MTIKHASVVLLAGAALTLCACGSKPPSISVGSKNTTEQLILGEIIATHLEKQLTGVQIERKLGLGGTIVVQGAMQSGFVDVYVEDVGTMIGSVLKEDPPAEESVAFERARAQYQALYRFAVLQPLGFHHQFVVVRRTEGTAAIKANSLTGIAESGVRVGFGVFQDLADRKDGFMALTTQYRIGMRALPRQLEPPALYAALKQGSIDLAAGYSTDSWLGQPGFVVLQDDRKLFAAHEACIVVRNQALAAVSPLQKALDMLAGKISDDAIHKLNQEVDLKHRLPGPVAKDFLATVGL